MLTYPQIDPVLLALGPLKVHWYGVMYLCAFGTALWLGVRRSRQANAPYTADHVSDLIFYSALGAVLGGRLGYVFFYKFSDFLAAPWEIFMVWQGGMSFHGGLIGVLLAMYWFSRHNQRHFFTTMDFIAPLVPLGLGFGRIGNFINGELWGAPSNLPWAMVFPHVDQLARHPSQLYEAILEGLVFFIILWIFSAKATSSHGSISRFLAYL